MTGYAIGAISGISGVAGLPGVSGARGSGPVSPVTPVQEVKSAMQTRSVTAPRKADEAEQVLGNGDFFSLSASSAGAYSTEPQFDALTSQRVWSA
ncbi:hypothetical protein LJC56_03135 [Christensenellaceae bacterium OttesenSCG-928-K19]|nr:hypothetical protein [Christensenellaceae bacterium OttesenSCG-928-K19]